MYQYLDCSDLLLSAARTGFRGRLALPNERWGYNIIKRELLSFSLANVHVRPFNIVTANQEETQPHVRGGRRANCVRTAVIIDLHGNQFPAVTRRSPDTNTNPGYEPHLVMRDSRAAS
jgi:hypothetical protein